MLAAVELWCCPRCRLLQPAAALCTACSIGEPKPILALTAPKVEGMEAVRKPPPRGWRDSVALVGTALGIFIASAFGFVVTGSPVGMLLGPALGAASYHKQFWKGALIRRRRLLPAPPPARPAGPPLVGIAERFERHLELPASCRHLAPATPLVVATAVATNDGVLVRAVDAVPFWLVIGERRILVTGACWAAGGLPDPAVSVDAMLRDLGYARIPVSHATYLRLFGERTLITPGDCVAVVGEVQKEQVAGVSGYRDSFTEVLRGHPGAPLWLERVEVDPRIRVE